MYYYDIQSLRGLLIICIVLFHLNYYKNGYVGVDALFVISGFLMKNTYDRSNINYSKFISKRLIRIYPLLHFTMVLFLFNFRNEEKENLLEIINEIKYGFSFISNYYYHKMERDYFHPSKSAKFLNIWAVCVEMQYYLICRIFIKNQKLNLLCSSISVIYYIYKNNELYYSLLGRLFEFNIGIVIYLLKPYTKYSKCYKTFVLIIFFIFPYHIFYSQSHIYSTLFTSLYIYIRSDLFHVIILDHIGDISYAIYLIHYPLIYSILNKIKYLLYLYIFSYLLTKIDIYIYYNMKNNTFHILLSFIISLIFGYSIIYYFKRTKYIGIINTTSNIHRNYKYTYIPLSSYKCHINNHNYNSILIIGDSHALPLIGMIYNFCEENRIIIYYKCIHTTYLVFSHRNYLYDLSMKFCIILFTHHYNKKIHSNSTNLINRIIEYVEYLKLFSNYIIYILPTPHLYHRYSCIIQINLKYAKKNIDIDINYISIDRLINIKNLYILDFNHFFCDKVYCNLTYLNNCIYRDDNHFTLNYIIYLTPYVMKYVRIYHFNNNNNNPFSINGYILLNNKMDKLWRIPAKNCKIKYIEVPY